MRYRPGGGRQAFVGALCFLVAGGTTVFAVMSDWAYYNEWIGPLSCGAFLLVLMGSVLVTGARETAVEEFIDNALSPTAREEADKAAGIQRTPVEKLGWKKIAQELVGVALAFFVVMTLGTIPYGYRMGGFWWGGIGVLGAAFLVLVFIPDKPPKPPVVS